MPEKEGAEEKTTKDVVTKRQKQLMNKEEYVQEMPDDVKNIMMKGLRKGAGEFSKGGDPKNIIKKGVKSTIKNVIKSKSVQNFLNNEYIPEEGYDVARDQGRVKPSKDKKDATTMPPSKEMEKTRKVNKRPSALERVKADIEKRYGKGAIMDVKKEELDLTQVAETFGGYIVEEPKNPKKKFKQGELKFSSKEPVRINDKNFQDLKDMVSGKKSSDDLDATREGKKVTKKPKVTSGSVRATDVKIGKGGQAELPLGDVSGQKNIKDIKNVSDATGRTTPVTGERIPGRKPGSKIIKKGTSFKQLRLKGTEVPVTSPKTGRVDLRTVNTKKRVTKKRPFTGPRTAKGQPILKKDIKRAVQGGVKSPAQGIKKITSAVPKQTQAVKNVAKKLTVGGKSIGKTVGKAAAGGLAKRTLGRAGAKLLATQIPGSGQVISGGEAIARFASGDVVGGALSAAEMIPGLGLLAGTANVARDISRTRRAVKTIKKLKPLKKGMKLLQKSKAGRTLSKMQRTARANPLATIGGGGIATGVGTNVATGGRRGKLPKVSRPKIGQGVVGRRTAGQ